MAKNEKDVQNVLLYEKRITELEALIKKLNKDISDKEDVEKRIMDYLKKRNEALKQTLTKYISEQVNLQFNKRVAEFEKRQSYNLNMTLDKCKEDLHRTITSQAHQIMEKQITELKKKVEQQNRRKSEQYLDTTYRKISEQMKLQVEKQVELSENKFFLKLSKKVDAYKKALNKEINLQVSRRTENKFAHLQSKIEQLRSTPDKTDNESKHSHSDQHSDISLDDRDVKTLDELNQEAMKIELKDFIDKQLIEKTVADQNLIMEMISSNINQKLEEFSERMNAEHGIQKHQVQEAVSNELMQKLTDLKREMEKSIDDQFHLVNLQHSNDIQDLKINIEDEICQKTSMEFQRTFQNAKETIEQRVIRVLDEMNTIINSRIDQSLATHKNDLLEKLNLTKEHFQNEIGELKDECNNHKLEIHLQKSIHIESMDYMKAFDNKFKQLSEFLGLGVESMSNGDQTDSTNVNPAFLRVQMQKNSVNISEEEIKLLINHELDNFRPKMISELMTKTEYRTADLLQQIDDRIIETINKYEDALHNRIFTKLIDEINTRKETLVMSIMERLRQDTILQIQNLQEDITRQWNEMSTIQKDEMVNRISSQVSQEVERTVSRLERSLSMQQEYIDVATDSGIRQQNCIIKDLLSLNHNSEEPTEDNNEQHPPVEHVNFRPPELIATISEINQHVIKIQDQLTTQIIEKVKLQEEEILNRLTVNMNEHFEKLQTSYNENVRTKSTYQEAEEKDDNELQVKINELTLMFSEQIRTHLEKHIENAKVPIQQLIETELDKIKQHYEGKLNAT